MESEHKEGGTLLDAKERGQDAHPVAKCACKQGPHLPRNQDSFPQPPWHRPALSSGHAAGRAKWNAGEWTLDEAGPLLSLWQGHEHLHVAEGEEA